MKKSDGTRIVIAAAITTIALIAMAVIIVVALWNVSSHLLGDGQTTTKTPTAEEALLMEVDDYLKQIGNLRAQVTSGQARVDAFEEKKGIASWWIVAPLMEPLAEVGVNLQFAGESLETYGADLKAERETNLADGKSFDERVAALKTGIDVMQDGIDQYTKAIDEFLGLIDEFEYTLLTRPVANTNRPSTGI